MFDIVHDLTIRAPMAKVFSGVSTPVGLDAWWTQSCKGDAALVKLGFGGNYFWMAAVTEFKQDETFALKITDAAADWVDTLVRFELESGVGATVPTWRTPAGPSGASTIADQAIAGLCTCGCFAFGVRPAQ